MGLNVFMADRVAPVIPLVVSFLILYEIFSPVMFWSRSIPSQTNQHKKRERNEKVNFPHFQAVEAICSSLNSLGLLLDHFNTGQFHTHVFTVV